MSPTNAKVTSGVLRLALHFNEPHSAVASVTIDNQIVNLPLTVNAPAFSIDDVTQAEGDSGTTSYTFTVTKNGASAFGSSIDLATVDGTATVGDGDYQATSGTLNFAANETIRQVTVLVGGDTTFEPERLHRPLSNGRRNVSVADGTGTTITTTRAFVAISGPVLSAARRRCHTHSP